MRTLQLRGLGTLLLLGVLVGIAHAELASVRYQRDGKGHHYLSTHQRVRVGQIDVSLHLCLLGDCSVAVYSESRRIDASCSELRVELELAGRASGVTLAGLGTLSPRSVTHA